MSLLPMIQPQVEGGGELPLCRDVAWDFAKNIPVWRHGRPVLVTGAEAVLSWCYRALQVPRFRHAIYSWNHGNECDGLIGSNYTGELKQAEAIRYVRECLEVNPYIRRVTPTVSFEDGKLTIDAAVLTIYGEVELHATV